MLRTAGIRALKIGLYLSLIYFSYLMLLITLQYLPLQLDVAFLKIKFDIITEKYYQIAFFSHVYTSIFVLFAGILQFSKMIRTRFTKLHRMVGKLYVLLILVVASPSGLIMGIHANGGPWSKLSFCIQAVLWFVFTFLAFRYAIKRKWTKHRAFMLRSFALTLSAISLRLFKWIIVSTLEWPPMDTYRLVAWLGWIVNILVVEIYIYHSNKSLIS